MATKANISIDQGASFVTDILLTDDAGNPLNLSAYTAQAQMKVNYSSADSISFTTNLSTGQVTLSLNAATTATLTRPRYIYDVLLIDSANTVTRVVEGVVYVDPSVTQPNVTPPVYYTLQVANVQSTIYSGDLVYQSNGSANVVGTVYEVDYLGTLANTANVVILKISNSTGSFITSNTNAIYDVNTAANGMVISVTQSLTE